MVDKTAICALTGKRMSRSQLVPFDLINRQIAERIRADHPELGSDAAHRPRRNPDRYRRRLCSRSCSEPKRAN
jgi:hypothetical protein